MFYRIFLNSIILKQAITKTILLVLLANSFCLKVTGQNKYNLKQYGSEAIDLIKQPSNWRTDDYLKLSLILGGTYALMQIDETIREEMLKDRSFVGSIPLEIGRYWGEPITSLSLGSIFLIHGFMRNNEPNKKLGFEIIQSFTYTIGITSFIKIAFGRARPDISAKAFDFQPIQFKSSKFWALPSGHTSSAFSFSTVLAANIDSDIGKVLVFIPPFITAFSRVYYNRHWVSDVFIGAVLGYFIGKFVTDLHEENEFNSNTGKPPDPVLSISIPF
ncbi:phosphatase PAP2 family protein [Bacteroidota bacterium]